MKTYILQEKVPSRSDFKWTFSRNCEGTEQLRIVIKMTATAAKVMIESILVWEF